MIIPSNSLQYLLDETLKECKGQRIQLKGTYLHDKEILLGPRSAPAGLFGAGAQGLASNPQGYYIITPLKRSDGTILFINRGWIPINMKEWNKPQKEIELIAIVSETEKKASFTPDNSANSNKLLWLEASTLLEITKLKEIAEPILIFEEINTNNNDNDNSNSNTIEYPAARKIDSIDSHYVTPATHFVYAITWFSLAIAGLGMTYYTLKRPTRLKKINKKTIYIY
jgi:surfeit locus 1 family protein